MKSYNCPFDYIQSKHGCALSSANLTPIDVIVCTKWNSSTQLLSLGFRLLVMNKFVSRKNAPKYNFEPVDCFFFIFKKSDVFVLVSVIYGIYFYQKNAKKNTIGFFFSPVYSERENRAECDRKLICEFALMQIDQRVNRLFPMFGSWRVTHYNGLP